MKINIPTMVSLINFDTRCILHHPSHYQVRVNRSEFYYQVFFEFSGTTFDYPSQPPSRPGAKRKVIKF
jgi:hypothetical protein